MAVQTIETQKKVESGEDGFVILEAVTFLMCFIIFTVYVVDLFTAVHTGILNSIAARTYVFETMEHRSNIGWLRQENTKLDAPRDTRFYGNDHQRFHATSDEGQDTNDTSRTRPSGRTLTMVPEDFNGGTAARPATRIIKVKTGYGICIDADCGG